MKTKLLFLVALSAFAPKPVTAQGILPQPRPAMTGGFNYNYNNTVTLPATVVQQSSLPPIPSGNAIAPRVAPFNTAFGNTQGGYLGGNIVYYYPPAYGYGYGYGFAPVINPTVNVNLSVVNPEPEYTPLFRVNPLYGVPPAEPVSKTTARVILTVPADAEVRVNGEKTPQKGTRRVYESPKLNDGKPFDFEIKIEWTEGEKKMTEEKKLSLSAGESRTLVIFANVGK